jgi:hypothetical protein
LIEYEILWFVIVPRGPLSARRMTAHWVVLAAAALTTLVAAAVGAALAAFAGQALPQAVRHDLAAAPGTSLAAQGAVSSAQFGPVTASLKRAVGAALAGVPFGFWQASWSDPFGFVPGALPGRPASVGPGTTPLLQAAAMTGVRQRAVLVAGQWPPAPDAAGAGGPIPAALPATAAALLHVTAGDVLRLRDRVSEALVTFRITGLFAERRLSGTAASYWQIDSIPAGGSSTTGGFITYGPLLVAPAAFPALPVSGGTWVAQPDMTAFTDTGLNAISAGVSALPGSLANSATLNGLQLSTGLPGVLSGTASNLAVARSLLVISALQLLVLTVAALLAVARLLATQREAETALLTARGATRWQLTRLTAAEVIPLCGGTALAGGAGGIWLARLLGGTLYPASLGGGAGGISAGALGTWLDALGAALAVAVIAIGAMLFPVLRPGPAAARVRRGRQAVIAGATRAGADLGLVVLAVLAGWQLRRYSAVSAGANGTAATVGPVLALAPALALAGGTVVTLRLLPAAARATDRLAARGRGLTVSLAGWQFSRQPLRQGGAALLLVMAVATGTLALAQHESWTRSAGDQAAFTTGADARIDLAAPLPAGATGTVTRATGVRDAMAVAVTPEALPAEIVAVDATAAPRVALLRADQSPLPPGRLFHSIAPAGHPSGTVISGRPDAIRLTATLGPAPDAGSGPVTATLTVADATGATYQFLAGTLPADGRPHPLTATLGGRQASYPLRLTQITLAYTLPARHAGPLTLTLAGVRLGGWTAAATSPELSSLQDSGGTLGPFGQPQDIGWRPAADGAALTFDPGFGQAAANPGAALPGPPEPVDGQVTLTAGALAPAVVPAIATRAFLDASNTGIGAIVPATINGVPVPVKIVAETTTFPTVAGSALIVDLTTIQDFLATRGGSPLPVTQWWIATAGHQRPAGLAGLAGALPPGSGITSAAALAAGLTSDPLSAAPQQALLAMAGAAALLAITGFWVSIAASVRQRRAENALLAALGVAQRSAAAQLFLEKLLLSVPSAALGLVLGTVVARLLVPAVTLTAAARQPVPPPLTLFDLSQTMPLAAIVAVLPALAAAFVMVRRPDPAAELRAAEAA